MLDHCLARADKSETRVRHSRWPVGARPLPCSCRQELDTHVGLQVLDHCLAHAVQTAVGRREVALWMLLYSYVQRDQSVACDVLVNLRHDFSHY